MGPRNGFVVSSWAAKGRVLATGRLESGESFALASKADSAAVLVPRTHAEAAERILERFGARRDEEAWSDLDGRPRVRFAFPSALPYGIERTLLEGGVPLPITDRGGADEFFSERGISAGLAIDGGARKGDRVDLVYVDPALSPAEARPGLRWLALDIETDRANRVLAVSLVIRNFGGAPSLTGEADEAGGGVAAGRKSTREGEVADSGRRGEAETRSAKDGGGDPGEVLFLGPELGVSWIRSFGDEASLLAALDERIVALDPDVVTGWNILEFDLPVLVDRHAALGLPFAVGRTRDPAGFVERPGKRRVFDLPGRAVLDGIRLMRSAGERFEDQSLETVARNVLGEGKTVASTGEDKLAELERLRAEEPLVFCDYCRRDSDLVLRILGKTGIAVLTARRAALTGLSLDLAWTSIPAFERVYDAALRARRIVAPARELRSVSGAAGGTVLEPRAGLFEGVIVLDFRSLYPSLIRTFNIDPLSHARSGDAASAHAGVRGARKLAAGAAPAGLGGGPAGAGGAAPAEGPSRPASDESTIMAPNGARFSREPGILPEVIARYTKEREAALAAGDEVGAFVYKILMNSFYGVLGSEGCRYARTELAGAITSFARRYLTFARDLLEERGYRILYGDTDSLFLETGLAGATNYATMWQLGTNLAEEVNAAIAADIAREYGVESFLRIRPDKVYSRFLIPRLRFEGGRPGGRGAILAAEGAGDSEEAEDQDGEARGRAKGYAGLRRSEGDAVEVEVKGMEAARSDGTALGRRFQTELLAIVFGAGKGGGERGAAEEAERYCRRIAAELRAGRLDGELVYRRWLRRPASEYGAENPAVRAARLLGWTDRRGRVSWFMTKAGAEPPERRSAAPLDYEHYVEKQLIPIAVSIGAEAGFDPLVWLADRPQMELGL